MKSPLLILLTLWIASPAFCVEPEKFLFVTFRGEGTPMTEQIHLMVSDNGLDWHALNNGEPVLVSNVGEKGVRDPYILRSRIDKKFYIIATDLSIHYNGDWGRATKDGSKSVVLWESSDLINWSTPRLVKVAPDDAGCTWAPECVYDEQHGEYIVFWASLTGRDNFSKHRIWAARTKDFSSFSAPFIYIEKPTTVIDTTIIRENGVYYRFTKDEKHKAITMEESKSLFSGWKETKGFTLDKLSGYEGPTCFIIEPATDNKPAKWCLLLDWYSQGKGYQPYETDNLATGIFTVASQMNFPFQPVRHGTVLPINQAEYEALIEKWPSDRNENTHNPILSGFYADPDIVYSHKTGRYYIYPTSDGFDGWSGTFFKTFSSENLVDWKDEGVILDLKTDVDWADRNAWAPCIIEKQSDGNYKYFYYFTAAQKIGVAVADSPTGPFTDSGQALIDFKPEGVQGGQEIDPDVFHDPVSDKDYLYWGNGYMAVAELNEDMVSINKSTLKVLTPDSTYREGTHVFYRNGVYYFLWSEDDTRSPNYRVRYATSPSPTGPLSIPEDNLVIVKDESAGIYGTGHNSTIQVPGRDEWYLVYHRFNYPHGITMGPAAGFHREVCIDRLEFDSAGRIIQIAPTHEGISPRK
jgi:GH43 family beta-xylosidase